MDPASGEVTDPRHPQLGERLGGRVVVMRVARGSSSSSSVLAEAARKGMAPAAFILGEPDLILAVGAAVADELYGVRLPVIVLAAADVAKLRTGDTVTVSEDGGIVIG
jgi:predicted aconitase with swiveling domain